MEAQKLRKKCGIEDKFVCLSWGRPGESKGFQYLINAAPKIHKTIPHAVILLMLGSPDKYPKNYRRLTRLAGKYPEIVKIVPSLPSQQLGTMIKAADCVIVPSLSEGFGYNVLEASSMGIPLVISNAGSLPEIVSGKHQIFQSKNILDLAEKVQMVAKGITLHKKQRKYLWTETISGYLDIYTKVSGKNQIKEQ